VDRSEGVRIERNRAAAARWYIARHRALRPEHGASIIEVAGGVAAWPSKYGSPSMGKAIAVALDGEMTAGDLDRIEALYAEAGVETKLSLCPFAHASAFALMAERRYVIVDHFNVLSRSLDDLPSPSLPVTRAGDYAEWTALVRCGMGEPEGDSVRAETIAVVIGEAPQMHAFIATIDGTPAGGAGLLVDEGIASLFATSVLAEHRRKGAQASLVAARLAHAKALGCDLAVAMADVGGDSQRNLERLGFRVGYTATVFSGSRSSGT
jgi:GNAT superfamily N-acetyltransferase